MGNSRVETVRRLTGERQPRAGTSPMLLGAVCTLSTGLVFTASASVGIAGNNVNDGFEASLMHYRVS